jgi:hypothetical protein
LKIFDLNWLDVLAYLDDWDQLEPTTQRAFAELKPGKGVSPARFGSDLDFLVERGFLLRFQDGSGRVKLDPRCHAFVRVIRSLLRNPILERPVAETLHDYLAEHFNADERSGLAGGGFGNRATSTLLATLTADRHLLEFLELEDAEIWEQGRSPNFPAWNRSGWGKPLLSAPEVLAATQGLVRLVREEPEPIPLRALGERLPEVSRPALASALFAAIRYVLVFPAITPDELVPVLCIWPGISARVHRPRSERPTAVSCEQTCDVAYLLDDLTELIVQVSASPPRLRGADHGMFERAHKILRGGLMELPHPMSIERVFPECARAARLDATVDVATSLGFVQKGDRTSRELRLETTAAGRAWLAKSPKERLEALLGPLRRQALACIDGQAEASGVGSAIDDDRAIERAAVEIADWEADEDDEWDEIEPWEEAPAATRAELDLLASAGSLGFDASLGRLLRSGLCSAFASLPSEGFLRVDEFVRHHAESVNPFQTLDVGSRQRTLRRWFWAVPSDEELEMLWQDLLLQSLHLRLIPMGAVRLGVHGDRGALCAQLTGIGRYLLGQADTFDFDEGEDAQVVVQPNFEVVFLEPSAAAEAALVRFAERTGRGLGTLFRITRESVYAAASAGVVAEDAIDTLSRLSARDLPENVVHEIRDWFSQCRRLAVEPAWVIRCPDSETAERVVAQGGRRLRRLSDTVVELLDRATQRSVIEKLKKRGLFVDPASVDPASRRRPRRRGR